MNQDEILEKYNITLDDDDNNNFDGFYQLLLDYEIASDDVLETITSITGHNSKTLLDILYVKTGLRSIEQLLDEISE